MSSTKQTKHTPGPWTSSCPTKTFQLIKAGRIEIVRTSHSELTSDQDEANARLIAAAPDGIELADWLLEYLRRNTLGTVPTEHGIGTVVDAHLLRCKIESFINKATGGGAK